MSPDRNEKPPDDWMTLSEIASLYRESASGVRLKLKKTLDSWDEETQKLNVRKGGGPKAASYSAYLVKETLGSEPDEKLTETVRSIFGAVRLPTVKVAAADSPREPLLGILASRKKAHAEYDQLLNEMIVEQEGLRIRCITGTDFFNSHRIVNEFLEQRVAKGRDAAKVLLVYPDGDAARIRSAAEGESNFKTSQFSRDARSTFEFFDAEHERLNLRVRWIDLIPPSFLIWTQEYALVEPYDFGNSGHGAGCIGRKAPLLLVSGATEYHAFLRKAFDHMFDGDQDVTHIQNYALEQVAAMYIALPAEQQQGNR